MGNMPLSGVGLEGRQRSGRPLASMAMGSPSGGTDQPEAIAAEAIHMGIRRRRWPPRLQPSLQWRCRPRAGSPARSDWRGGGGHRHAVGSKRCYCA
ncbi:hypothetical protein LNP74_31800 [Klebsiella pneumoniae subsp. pneumoniae]|nr:hypothetical protein [Klebsiella pneumoniae subsp. pneumoniae]